jgi:hypothetical protein
MYITLIYLDSREGIGTKGMAFENYWERNGVTRTFNGFVDGQQVLDSIVEIGEDSRFDSVRYVINDFLNVVDIDISDRDVFRIAAIDRGASITNPNIRIAVVTNDNHMRDLAQRYGELMKDSPYQTLLFESIDAAREWAC